MTLRSAAAILLLACTGCGYHTGGRASTLPSDVKTISIPAFANGTQVYRVEQVLTSAVVREFITRTHYKVLQQKDPSADAVLTGAVLTTNYSPLTYDTRSGHAATVLVQVAMKVSLTNRKGKVLFENPSYLFREQYQVSTVPASFFEEDSPAFQRLARDFAHSLVSDILEAY